MCVCVCQVDGSANMWRCAYMVIVAYGLMNEVIRSGCTLLSDGALGVANFQRGGNYIEIQSRTPDKDV